MNIPHPLDLRPATPDDFEWSHDMTRANMEEYVVRHWGPWSREIFTANYRKGRNYILWIAGIRAGYLRLLPQPPVLFIDDLQIAPKYQRQGHGTAILAHLNRLLPQWDCRALRLRVYHENPARRLYLRVGFREIQRHEGTSILERSGDLGEERR
jgi:ribosomal protein S18 acetylase RimI-like enzyme